MIKRDKFISNKKCIEYRDVKKSIPYTLLRSIKGNKERRKVIHRIKGKNEAGQEQTMESINQVAVRGAEESGLLSLRADFQRVSNSTLVMSPALADSFEP